MRCDQCKFYDAKEVLSHMEPDGYCLRFPPIVTSLAGPQSYLTFGLPVTTPDNWCGEFQTQQTKSTE
jgi:hypothetical protein